MNNTYYETLDENFKEAITLIEKSFTHEELIEMLKTGNIPQKQFAAIKIDKIVNSEDAKIILNNLTGQDGKIREAISFKIKELASNNSYSKYFEQLNPDFLTDCFINAIIDINGNICRNILETLEQFKNNKDFTKLFIYKLILLINKLLIKIKNFDIKERKYRINKEVFKLYWCLEAIYIYYDLFNIKDIKNIIQITKNIDDYTIREKTAKILSKETKDTELLNIKKELKNDRNYYVRRF